MMDEQKIKKNGIFIHELPYRYIREVLSLDCFPIGSIYNYYYDSVGLHIYFWDSNKVTEFANYREIQVREHTFYIYLEVTNLTVHGIAAYTGDIKDFIQSNLFEDIVDLYEAKEYDSDKSSITLLDYRVILNIPEIFCGDSIRPIRWPERPGFAFCVSFYCRLCHKNGHKTFACGMYFKMKSDFVINRSITQEISSPDLRDQHVKHSEPQSKAASPHDHNTCRTSHSAAFDSSRFHICSKEIEPHLNMTDNTLQCTRRQSDPGASTSQPGLQREVSLSEGIREAITKSHYQKSGSSTPALDPDSLINFLYQVRRRKDEKFMEITLIHTKDISGLIHQLQLVKNTYYRKVKTRGANEDRDISYLKQLIKRLQKLISK